MKAQHQDLSTNADPRSSVLGSQDLTDECVQEATRPQTAGAFGGPQTIPDANSTEVIDLSVFRPVNTVPVGYVWRSFDIVNSAEYQIDVMSSRGIGDPVLWLYDSNKSLLADDDDGGSGVNAQVRRFLDPGKYLVGVRSLGNRQAQFDIRVASVEVLQRGKIPPVNLDSIPKLVIGESRTVDTQHDETTWTTDQTFSNLESL